MAKTYLSINNRYYVLAQSEGAGRFLNKERMPLIALILAIVALGGNFFVLYTNGVQLDQSRASLSNQVTGLQATVSGLQATISSLNSELGKSLVNQTAQQKELTSTRTSLAGIQVQLSNLLADLNSNKSSNLAFQGLVVNQLNSINSTLKTLTERLNAIVPTVPLATLVVTADTYDSSTATFTLTVRNNLNLTVLAQLTATIYGTLSPECNGVAGSYTSQVLQFAPGSVTQAQLVLSQGVYNGCGGNPISSVSLAFMAGQTMQVSLRYTFQVTPPYTH